MMKNKLNDSRAGVLSPRSPIVLPAFSPRRAALDLLLRLVTPVFEAAAEHRLQVSMPVESFDWERRGEQPAPVSWEFPNLCKRTRFSYLEAFCRSFAGLAPWLEIEDGDDTERAERVLMREKVSQGLASLADCSSPDHPDVSFGHQTLVEAAHLASGILRSWESVWLPLPETTKRGLIDFLISNRRIKPAFSNWLLFSAMVEAFLCRAGEEWDPMRVDYALRQHEQWYHGDGIYGDGPHFQWDYYNSYAIQPMLHEVANAHPDIARRYPEALEPFARRLGRYAEILERLISPEGTFPALGRSMAYRTGAFHALAYAAWKHLLPETLAPAAVRGALGAVYDRVFSAPGTFDDQGWLRIGVCGSQPSIGDHYTSTGSLYLAAFGFLTLGLPASDSLWADPDADWTSKKLWSGADLLGDHALRPDIKWMS